MSERRRPATQEEVQKAVNLSAIHGQTEASKIMGVARSTLQHWVREAKRKGITPEVVTHTEEWAQSKIAYEQTIHDLELKLSTIRRDSITARAVRASILKLSEAEPRIPKWAIKPGKLGERAGVPVLKLSDLHWGEVVDPAQINGVNEYNLDIAHKRIQRLADKVVSLCFNHMGASEFPGIVVAMEGDLISGDIHSELTQTNELPTMPTFLDLYGALIWFLEQMERSFGRVFVVNVPGNHSRLSPKPVYKGRNYSNWDWLMGQFLERHFQARGDVRFLCPDAADAYYTVAGHEIMSTHGDALGTHGGDGLIGAIGPIVRGDVKTRRQADSVGMRYKTLSIGHWHQYMPLVPRVMVNSSFKGFDEFTQLALRAPFEPPSQMLYFVHEDHGVTAPWAVFVDDPKPKTKTAWVSWQDAA